MMYSQSSVYVNIPRTGWIAEIVVKAKRQRPFDQVFLSTADAGRTISKYRKNQAVFFQGDAADAVFYMQDGKVKVTVVSE